MNCPENLLYTKEHEWVKKDDDFVIVGITDYAQGELGDVVFVELPSAGAELEQSKTFGVVESVKTVSDLYAPLSGKVTEINALLESEPEQVNSSPYEKGWMIKLELKNKGELGNLLSATDYKKFVEEESA